MFTPSKLHWHCPTTWWVLGITVLAVLGGCSAPPRYSKLPPAPPAAIPMPPQAPAAIAKPPSPPVEEKAVSQARSGKEYRKDAADHLYKLQSQRIYKGRLPPMLEAVGVLDVEIDQTGWVKTLKWQRAPQHVPRVMAEIEHMVKTAAPYPIPKNMRQVTYTDVWLWHKSGQFQLDTLTEGQD